jgi:MFS family permease
MSAAPRGPERDRPGVGVSARPAAPPVALGPALDRHNGIIFASTYLFIFFAAPVIYIGVVQAALCNKLGASATVANLPTSAYLFGAFASFVLSWLMPHRLDRAVVVGANVVTASSMLIVCTTLFLPFSNTIRIAAVIGQGLLQGFSGNVSQVYTYQCLGRGTTEVGRARAMKVAFTFGPLSAVAGSLWAQFVLNHGIAAIPYPYDFGLLYLIGLPCSALVAILSSRYRLPPVPDEPSRPPFFRYLVDSVRSYARERDLVLLWFAYLLWYCTLNAMSNLALFTREAVGRDPKELSGVIMALRFGFKAMGGFALGALALRWGMRAPVVAAVLLVGGGLVWAWVAPGYAYLLAFGLMGAGELGGAYFPNYQVTLSTPATGARDLALQSLVSPVSGLAPAIHGALTDHFGFRASFAFGIFTAAAALALVLRLPARSRTTTPTSAG